MRIGSLFSGIGLFELGLEWAGLGRTVWQVEQSAWCRAILADHYPEVDRSVTHVEDATKENLAAVDCICGGFPCQDISSAGPGEGLSGSRSGLWSHFARLVHELQPTWTLVENVESGAGRWVDAVVARLEDEGYEALPVPLSAEDVGASQKRSRVFVVARRALANPLRIGREAKPPARVHAERQERYDAHRCDPDLHWVWPPRPEDSEGWARYRARYGPEPALRRGFDGATCGMAEEEWRAQLRGLGNAVSPLCTEVIGHLVLELEERKWLSHGT